MGGARQRAEDCRRPQRCRHRDAYFSILVVFPRVHAAPPRAVDGEHGLDRGFAVPRHVSRISAVRRGAARVRSTSAPTRFLQRRLPQAAVSSFGLTPPLPCPTGFGGLPVALDTGACRTKRSALQPRAQFDRISGLEWGRRCTEKSPPTNRLAEAAGAAGWIGSYPSVNDAAVQHDNRAGLSRCQFDLILPHEFVGNAYEKAGVVIGRVEGPVVAARVRTRAVLVPVRDPRDKRRLSPG